MSAERIVPVVLCGGLGTRLAPLSRPDRPKPLLPLGAGGRTLLRDTLDRLAAYAPPLLLCGEAHADAMRAEAGGAACLVEPGPRGTAAAAVAAALAAAPDDLVLLAPADHAVGDPDALRAAIDAAAPVARGRIVTFGVRPSRADPGFGWIRPGAGLGSGVREVAAFVEKPSPAVAERLLADGWLWNAGMFLARAGLLVEEAARHAPALVAAVRRAFDGRRGERLGDAFASAPAGSLDVIVLERTDRAAVIPVSCGWSDLGTWDAVRAHHGDAFADALLVSSRSRTD